MALLTLPRCFHVNSGGTPYALARLYHYRATTLTTLNLYTTSSLAVPHAQPIVADANGLFPAIYVDPNSGYDLRLILKTSADATIYDEDSIQVSQIGNSEFAPTLDDNYDLGNSTNRWQDLHLRRALKLYDSTNYAVSTETNALSANRTIIVPDADILLGGTFIRTVNANYTFVMGDTGHTLYHSSASAHTFTIPVDASVNFNSGTVVEIYNAGTGAVTISSSATIITNTYPYTGSVVLNYGQYVRLKKVTTNVWLALDTNNLTNVAGSFTATLSGMTTTTTGTINYLRSNNSVTLYAGSQIAGTSNATSMSLSGLPAALATAFGGAPLFPCLVRDNGSTKGGWAAVGSSISFYFGMETPSASGFTNSGSKGLPADFIMTYQLTYQ